MKLAEANGRNYITPEDVENALKTEGVNLKDVQLSVLEALAKKQAEDWSLCAFIAWTGKVD